MFNCDHCQKKYKRSWHQARHSQMKHENSNASTATTSSAGTPPTPEINGNIPTNNNYNYQQLQQVPQMPPQPIAPEINQIHQQNVAIPAPETWSPMNQQHQTMYAAAPNEIMGQNVQQPIPPPAVINEAEYANYAVNEQYSNKFEQAQPPPAPYDSWVS